jgi:hypothetical protein
MSLTLSDPGPGMVNLTSESLCWGCAAEHIFAFNGRWVVFQPPSEVYRVFCNDCLYRFTRKRPSFSLLVVRFEEWVENNRRRRWWDEMQELVWAAEEDTRRRLCE